MNVKSFIITISDLRNTFGCHFAWMDGKVAASKYRGLCFCRKTAELIEILGADSGGPTGPWNHVLDGGPVPPGNGNLWGCPTQ